MFEVRGTITYQRLRPIGVGEGMNSNVYLSFDPVLRRDIAVKEIEKSKFGNDFDSYCNEARVMFASSDPNIVGLEFVCETADCIALALPYFANGSLNGKIGKNPLRLRDFLKLTQSIVAGLARIHTSGFIHLDLKPSNILFDNAERPLISDFGQSRRVSATGTVTFPAVYKWSMPPEVLRSNVATIRSDIYQLGILLYRSVNGNLPYSEQKSGIASNTEFERQVIRGRFPDRNFFLPHVPRRIRSIIRKAMRTEPTERYGSAIELGAAMGRVPLLLDWSTTSNGGGAYTWRAVRPGKSDLEAMLVRQSATKWRTEVWTVRPLDRRRKNVGQYWKSDLSYEEAFKHLTEVFAELNQ
jgi:serine/threonine protein kinase